MDATPGSLDCLHLRFDEQAARTPAAIAAVCDDETITYEELAARARRVAAFLLTHGIRHNELIGIYQERSIPFIVAMIGALKAGACCVPIDPAYTAERVALIIDKARLRVLLVDTVKPSNCPDSVRVLTYQAASETALPIPETPAYDQGDLAFVFFTSGSTGSPKGVMMTHEGRIASVHWMTANLEPCRSHLFKSSITHNPMIREVFWPLLTGSTVVVVPESDHRDILRLRSLIEKHRVESVGFAPSMLKIFIRNLAAGDCASIKHVVCGGEPISNEVIEEFHSKLPHARLLRFYGLTEAGMAFYLDCHKECDGRSLGYPTYVTIHLLDRDLRPAAENEVGEIFISGTGIAAGYLHDKTLTQSTFVTDPFIPGQLMFGTGDRAIRSTVGEYFFVDRVDRAVNIRGIRVELGEIEHHVNRLPFVDDSVALKVSVKNDDKLVCFYVLNRPSGPRNKNSDNVRGQLFAIPSTVVPHRYIQKSSLPTLPNGKIDVGQLRNEAIRLYVANDRTVSRPGSDFYQIVQDIVGTAAVFPSDRFFSDLGGDSLMAMELVVAIHDAFGVNVPLEQIYLDREIGEIKDHIFRIQRNESGTFELPCIDVETISPSDEFPLSINQLAILKGGPAYHHVPVVVTGQFDVSAFAESLERVGAINPILRGQIFSIDGRDFQRMSIASEELMDFMKLQGTSDECRAACYLLARDHGTSTAADGRAISVLTIWTREGEFVLSFRFHAAYFDGLSIRFFFSELSIEYERIVNGSGRPVPMKPRGFLDYVFWEYERFLEPGGVMPATIETIAGDLRQVRSGRISDPNGGARGELTSRVIEFDAGTASALKAIGGGHGLSASRLFLGMTALWLADREPGNNVVIDVMGANRALAGMANMIGPLSSRIPIVFEFPGSDRAAVLGEVRRATERLYRQNPPFPVLRGVLGDDLLNGPRVLISEFTNNLRSLQFADCQCNWLPFRGNEGGADASLDEFTNLVIRFLIVDNTCLVKCIFRETDVMSDAVGNFQSFFLYTLERLQEETIVEVRQ